MSRKLIAAILTQTYLQNPDPDSAFFMDAPAGGDYSSAKGEIIGRVYAGFLKDLPKFEKWAEGKKPKG